jgi:hypothetical protein
MTHNPLDSVHAVTEDWIEAAVDLKLDFSDNTVDVNYFARDANVSSGTIRVEETQNYIPVAKVLMCFSLAMALEIFALMRPHRQLQDVTVHLEAGDKGNGKLFQYYTQYGLRKNPFSHFMQGSLRDALLSCVEAWKAERKCELASCQARGEAMESRLSQVITAMKDKRSLKG